MKNKKQSILKRIIIFTVISILIFSLLVSTFSGDGETSNWFKFKFRLKDMFYLFFVIPIAIIGYYTEKTIKKKK